MINLKKIALFTFTFLITNTVLSQGKEDYLKIGNKMMLDGQNFNLEWSSHPNKNYFKHEYIQKGDTVEKFNEMIIIEALNAELTVDQAAGVKIIKHNRRWNHRLFTFSRTCTQSNKFISAAKCF